MNWRVNKDEALELLVDSKCVGGLWRGAWRERGEIIYGYLAATWHPYERAGRFSDVKAAKAAVEKVLT